MSWHQLSLGGWLCVLVAATASVVLTPEAPAEVALRSCTQCSGKHECVEGGSQGSSRSMSKTDGAIVIKTPNRGGRLFR